MTLPERLGVSNARQLDFCSTEVAQPNKKENINVSLTVVLCTESTHRYPRYMVHIISARENDIKSSITMDVISLVISQSVVTYS